MNKLTTSNLGLFILIVTVIVFSFILVLKQNPKDKNTFTVENTTLQITPTPLPTPKVIYGKPYLSPEKKAIILDDKEILQLAHPEILTFFREQSSLCDSSNIESTPNRRAFCEDITVFTQKASFSSIVVSPDASKIGFTITTDELSPDTVVGLFQFDKTLKNSKVYLLTNYYLGNEFLSFSPNGVNFAYKGFCFEGKCGFVIKDSETLEEKASINNPEFLDGRVQDATFVKWLSANEIEYLLDAEALIEAF